MQSSVASALRDLKMKCAAYSRCVNEYGTYLEELELDKKRLEQLKADGKETRQQEQVIEETTNMIPITQKNAEKMAKGLIDTWSTKKEVIREQLTKSGSDGAKSRKELLTQSRNLGKLTVLEDVRNPLAGTDLDHQLDLLEEEMRQVASINEDSQ